MSSNKSTRVSNRRYAEKQPYRTKVKNMFSDNPKVRIVRDTSLNAAKMFDDEYFDFIDINAIGLQDSIQDLLNCNKIILSPDISLSEIISLTKYRFLSHFSELFKIDCNSLLSTSSFLSLFLMT